MHCVKYDNKLIFGQGTKLIVSSREVQKPDYYKVGNYCLATSFTAYNATDNTWPVDDKTKAVRFSDHSFYSRILLDNGHCNITDTECKIENEFYPNKKSNLLTLSIFWLRILFLKTVVLNVLMTIKAWKS
ncbi:hypothetical protein P4O66_017029 [Electrophorus voltai]|uniref:T-cell receptor alpha chain constant domain-containing protein n=1 Tax=Electrophorus voltai TaxID=2609070 RepID=A0AAD9DPJ1_9TELE|nr:hypothetical protein P4O66_017029 [Electrophorus voltai]